MQRESMEVDVVIVGAGPAGLTTACRLMQMANEAGRELSICVLEKGSEVGAHILSGAVFEPSALNQLHSIAGRTPRRIDSVCRGAARRAIHQRRRASIDDLSATAAALPDGPADLRSTAFGR